MNVAYWWRCMREKRYEWICIFIIFINFYHNKDYFFLLILCFIVFLMKILGYDVSCFFYDFLQVFILSELLPFFWAKLFHWPFSFLTSQSWISLNRQCTVTKTVESQSSLSSCHSGYAACSVSNQLEIISRHLCWIKTLFYPIIFLWLLFISANSSSHALGIYYQTFQPSIIIIFSIIFCLSACFIVILNLVYLKQIVYGTS